MLTRDEIRAIYDAGPEAVIALVEQLMAQIAKQQEQINGLTARVSELESRLATNSRNSSKPPSSDDPQQRTRSLRRPSGKKPGAQVGHPGKTLKLVAQPHRVIDHAAAACGGCGESLAGVAGERSAQRRQVFDLPPLCLEVSEHRVVVKQCPACGQQTTGQFPPQVKPSAHYGPQVRALALCLSNEQLLPSRRTCQLLGDLFGQPLAEGTLQSALAEASEELQAINEQIKQAITRAPVAHFDETGCYVEGRRDWLHVASTATLTYYAHHHKRGARATAAIGILPTFTGRAVHDSFHSYRHYQCEHALCNAHHLRELIYLEEVKGRTWAGQFKELLLKIKKAVDQARAASAHQLPTRRLTSFAAAYQELIEQGLASEQQHAPPPTGKRGPKKQSKAKNLLDRLDHHRAEVLAFMYDFDVPFDNNLAERDLRMIKVQQKVSGTFRTTKGAKDFCHLRGYISTLKKQGLHVFSALTNLFSGLPIVPALDG